jgi:hypothetical protein
VAIPNPTWHYGWSTLEQEWKPIGRLTYYTIAWPNDRAVYEEEANESDPSIFQIPVSFSISN